MTHLSGKIFQSIPCFEDHLKMELGEFGEIEQIGDSLFHCNAEINTPIFWQSNIWQKPFRFDFDSVSQAAALLCEIQRNWAPVLFCCYRRAELIKQKLPFISAKPKSFPWTVPKAPMGAWTLLNEHSIIASAECTSPFPGGAIEFEQNKTDPPSRAYLKLQEALTFFKAIPKAGDKCFDAGAAPGGWTWVLLQLGSDVIACDRSPLAPRLQCARLEFIAHDAFTLNPKDIGKVDWLLCDVVCYPKRLLGWIQKWLESELCKNFVCTIKMQGDCDFETVKKFAAIPDSKVIHLYHNKHELTWIKQEGGF
ncbi:MAG: hypothetical protein LBV52_04380 [Spirochaetaceae bacterium]|jgi:23S rRNA (cytidine2498-2'-O)-methyltransferase|nr:hypothetical protein [Spirochaetaceae bacterium]